MNLINRYISEVSRQLPEKNRTDLEQEIRSLIEDTLEDRAEKKGRPVDEDMMVEVLKEFGPPEKMALSYQPERYLIGPKLFPAFLTVVKIALPVIIVLSAIAFGIKVGQSDLGTEFVIEAFIEGMADFVGSIILALGNIVLIFAALEWLMPGLKIKTEEKDWDPRKLPATAAPPEKVKIVDLAFEIAFTVVALVIFNFYPQIIGISYSEGAGWVSIPVLASVFFTRYLPWLNIVWLAQIVLDMFLIGRGRWEILTSWLYVAIKFSSIIIALAMLTGPGLIAITAETLAEASSMGLQAATTLIELFNQIVRISLVLTIIFGGLDLVKVVWRLAFANTKPPVLVRER